MKVTIELDSAENAVNCLDAPLMSAALREIDEFCRQLLKHGMGNLTVGQALEQIRELTRYKE
jgi:hypothetical protein